MLSDADEDMTPLKLLPILRKCLLVSLMLSCCGIVNATTLEVRTFEYLGGKSFQHDLTRLGYPEGARSKGYRVEDAGLKRREATEGVIEAFFNFTLKTPRRVSLESIVVEDVTGDRPSIVVSDMNPVVKKRQWLGETEMIVVTRETMPWLYTKGDSWRIFRITVTTSKGKKISMLQPVYFSWTNKSAARLTRQQLLKAIKPKRAPQRERLRNSAVALLASQDRYLFVELEHKPSEQTVTDVVEALKHAVKVNVPLVIASAKQEWADELLTQLLESSRQEDLKQVKIAVVSPEPDVARWEGEAQRYQTTIQVGPLLD